jgi:hypothetical protein
MLAEEEWFLLDDGLTKLNISLRGGKYTNESTAFGDEATRESFEKLDFSGAQERLKRIKLSVPDDEETLFKAKVHWDALSDVSPHYVPLQTYPWANLCVIIAHDRPQIGAACKVPNGEVSGRIGR